MSSAKTAGFDEFREGCTSWFQRMFKAQHRLRYIERTRSGDAHHADAATTWRRGDGDDRVVEVHGAIVAGKLEDNQRPRSRRPGLEQICSNDLEERTKNCQSPTNF